jgi:cell division septation protein DedD
MKKIDFLRLMGVLACSPILIGLSFGDNLLGLSKAQADRGNPTEWRVKAYNIDLTRDQMGTSGDVLRRPDTGWIYLGSNHLEGGSIRYSIPVGRLDKSDILEIWIDGYSDSSNPDVGPTILVGGRNIGQVTRRVGDAWKPKVFRFADDLIYGDLTEPSNRNESWRIRYPSNKYEANRINRDPGNLVGPDGKVPIEISMTGSDGFVIKRIEVDVYKNIGGEFYGNPLDVRIVDIYPNPAYTGDFVTIGFNKTMPGMGADLYIIDPDGFEQLKGRNSNITTNSISFSASGAPFFKPGLYRARLVFRSGSGSTSDIESFYFYNRSGQPSAGNPQGSTMPPQGYASEPSQAYAAEPPQAFAGPPQPFAGLPQAPVEPPQAFSEFPQAYRQPPQTFSGSPQAYTELPQPFTEPPQPYKQPSQSFSGPPQVYSEPPMQSYSKPPQAYKAPRRLPQIEPSQAYIPPGPGEPPPFSPDFGPVSPPDRRIIPIPRGNYTVQVASNRIHHNAVRLQDHLRRRGYLAYISEIYVPGLGRFFRVRVGTFPDRYAAERVAYNLQVYEGLETWITRDDPYWSRNSSHPIYKPSLVRTPSPFRQGEELDLTFSTQTYDNDDIPLSPKLSQKSSQQKVKGMSSIAGKSNPSPAPPSGETASRMAKKVKSRIPLLVHAKSGENEIEEVIWNNLTKRSIPGYSYKVKEIKVTGDQAEALIIEESKQGKVKKIHYGLEKKDSKWLIRSSNDEA